MSSNNLEFPLSFRTDDIQYVMHILLAGKSCALIGVAGVGKSVLMRCLESASLQGHYLKERKKHFVFLPIDAHALAEPSALAYYRRMAFALEPTLTMNQLSFPGVHPLSITSEELAKQTLFDSSKALIEKNEQQILVFLFDAFDVAFTEVEQHFFRVLEALRSHFKGHICYVIACDNIPILPGDMRSRRIVRDMFIKIFNGNIRGIKPLEMRDVYYLMEHHFALTEESCPLALRPLLVEITGAHVGMLKATLAAFAEKRLSEGNGDTHEQIINTLLNDPPVFSSCEQIWNSLSDIEQAFLRHMQRGILLKDIMIQQYSIYQVNEAIDALLLKGILREISRGKVYRCFSPLLTSFITRQVSPGLQLDFSRKQVWVDGMLQAEHLTPREFKLLSFLSSHTGEVCSREETTRAVYGEAYRTKDDDARLDALVGRVRKCLGDDPRKPRFLETVRGMGHRLNEYLGKRSWSP